MLHSQNILEDVVIAHHLQQRPIKPDIISQTNVLSLADNIDTNSFYIHSRNEKLGAIKLQ